MDKRLISFMEWVRRAPVCSTPPLIDEYSTEWCKTWTLEAASCLLFGNEEYRKLPYPCRPEHFCANADLKRKMVTTLRQIKDFADTLFIAEVCWGLDLLMAQRAKKWKKVICYDAVPDYEPFIKGFFKDIEIDFFTADTRRYSFRDVLDPKENMIFILNNRFYHHDPTYNYRLIAQPGSTLLRLDPDAAPYVLLRKRLMDLCDSKKVKLVLGGAINGIAPAWKDLKIAKVPGGS